MESDTFTKNNSLVKSFLKTAFLMNPKMNLKVIVEKDQEILLNQLLKNGFEEVKDSKMTHECQYVNFN